MNYALSPMDYYFYRPTLYTIQFVFEYKGQLDPEHLQMALNKTSQVFPVIKSRIEILSKTTIILRGHKGPIPILTEKLMSPPNLDDPTQVDLLINPVVNQPDQPLLKFKISFYKENCYVGISFSHMLGDGHSFMMFLRSLSQASLSQTILDQPCNKRENLLSEEDTGKASDSLMHLYQNTGYVHPRPENPKACQLEKIQFTHEELKTQKLETFSTNSLLMAKLLKKYHRHIPLTEKGKLIVRCPVDYRKLYSRTSPNYFGNAVRDAVTSFDPETFEQLEINQVAEKIQASVTAVSENNIQTGLKTLRDLRMEHGIDIFKQIGCPGLLVSNVSKFPFYDIDFGIGKPSAIHHASQNPRLAVILPHANGVEVRTKLPLPIPQSIHTCGL